MPENAIYHVRMVGQLHGQIVENGFFFVDAGIAQYPNHGESLQHLLQDFHTYIKDHYVGLCSVEFLLRGFVGTTIAPKFGPVGEIIYNNVLGAQNERSLPSYCAALISWSSGFGGRSRRGRSYIAGIPQTFETESLLSPAGYTAVENLARAFLQRWGPDGTSHSHQICIYSPKLGDITDPAYPGIPIQTFAGISPITTAYIRTVLGTQRKRKLGRGV